MKLFVTGSSGFVASRLVTALVDAGHTVVGYDLNPTEGASEVETIVGDLSRGEGLEHVDFSQFDVVAHLAAAGVTTPTRTWPLCTGVNVVGTQRLLYAMAQAESTPALVHTRSFYERHVWDEDESFTDNPYVVSKHMADQLVRAWADQDSGRRVISSTVFQAYGPGNDPTSVLTYAAKCCSGKIPATFGSGLVYRDWIYLDDLISGLVASVEIAAEPDRAGVSEYDLGTGELTSLKELVLKMATMRDVPDDALTFDPSLDRRDTQLRDAASTPVPGWTPKVDLDTGLRRLLESFDGEEDHR